MRPTNGKIAYPMGLIVIVVLSLMPVGESLDYIYEIKGRTINNTTEALSMLRRMLFVRRDLTERCQYYIVLLNEMMSSQVTQKYISNLGMMRPEQVAEKFNKLDVLTISRLYMKAIDEELSDVLDQSFSDLYKCLWNDKFKIGDVTVKRYLNKDGLKITVDQFDSIQSQPALFILKESDLGSFSDQDWSITEVYKHPTIEYKELTPPMKRYVDFLFGTEQEAAKHFQSDSTEYQDQSQKAESPKVKKVAKKVKKVEGQAESDSPKKTKQADQSTPEKQSASPVKSKKAPPPKSKAPVQKQPEPEPKPVPEPEPELSESELAHLGNLIESLKLTYNNLPIESRVFDRCSAYSEVLSMIPLTEEKVVQLIEKTKRAVEALKPDLPEEELSKPFMPDWNSRDNFLFVLMGFGLESLGDDLYLDLVGCLSPWDDEPVLEFFQMPETIESLQKVLPPSEEEIQQKAS